MNIYQQKYFFGDLCASRPSDLKSTHLVCKSIAFTPEMILFSHLLLTPIVPSFEKLEHIARHQTLRLHVRRSTYDGLWLLEEYKNYDVWMKTIGTRLELHERLARSRSISERVHGN